MSPSLTKIVCHDWPALFSLLFIPVIWIIHFTFPYIKSGASAPMWIATTISTAAIISLIWRVQRINKLFKLGIPTHGVCLGVQIKRDRGLFSYSYKVDDKDHLSWCPVHKSKYVLSFEIGQNITVLYDQSFPKRSIVKDLFVNANAAEQDAAANP